MPEAIDIQSYSMIKSSLEEKINNCEIKVNIINKYLNSEASEIDEYEQDILDGNISATTTRDEYYNDYSDIEEDVISINSDINEEPILIDNPTTLDSISSRDIQSNLLSNEILALMLESKSKSRKAFKNVHSTNYDPLLIHEGNSKAFIEMLSGLNKDRPFHYDLILRNNDVHCSALQIHSDGDGEINLYYADAAGAISNINLVEEITKNLKGNLFANYKTGTQKSNKGCTIFSIQDLNSLSKLNKIELELLPTEDLSPILLKNSQSYSLIDNYLSGSPISSPASKGKPLSEIVGEFSITGIDFIKEERKKKNFRIIFKELKYLNSALTTLNQAYLEGGEEKIQEIIKKRWAKLELNKIYIRMDLSSEQIERVNGLYNPRQIDLVLNHNLPKDLFIQSQWLKDKETEVAAYNYIISADSNQNMITRAEEVKKLTNPEMIELLDKFGLESHKILDSAYFKREQMDSTLRPMILNSLNLIYSNEEGDILTKKNAAREFFNSIYTLKDSNQIVAIIDYKLDPKLVKKAKCFKYYGGGNIALKWIKQAYNDPTLTSITERKQAAENIFILIKDIVDMKEIDQISKSLTKASLIVSDINDHAKTTHTAPSKKALQTETKAISSKS